MSMDNRVFNVNGSGQEMLLRVLELAFDQEGKHTTAKAYSVNHKNGLILYWSTERGSTEFLTPLNAKQVVHMVWAWLNDKDTKIKLTGWDEDADHDGHNTLGWRVYCENWGHVNESPYAIVAITPAYMWHGK